MKPSILIDSIGLNSKSADDTSFVLFHCQGIQDIEAFYEYCIENKDMIEYQTKKERFVSLARRYKNIQTEKYLPYDKAGLSSKKLTELFNDVRLFLKNEIELGRNPNIRNITSDGKKYFNDKQVDALEKIGSVSYLIYLSEHEELQEMLIELYIEEFKNKLNYKSLSDGEKKVKALLGGVK